MTYRLRNCAAAIRAAHSLNDDAPDGVAYRARRYPNGQKHPDAPPDWGVIKLVAVPDALRKHWPDGKPDGFVWFGV